MKNMNLKQYNTLFNVTNILMIKKQNAVSNTISTTPYVGYIRIVFE